MKCGFKSICIVDMDSNMYREKLHGKTDYRIMDITKIVIPMNDCRYIWKVQHTRKEMFLSQSEEDTTWCCYWVNAAPSPWHVWLCLLSTDKSPCEVETSHLSILVGGN